MIALMVVGVLMIGKGCQLRKINKNTTSTPETTTLSELEQNGVTNRSRYIKIVQDHYLLHEYSAYEKQELSTYQKKASAFPKIDNVYYPMVSADHTIIPKINDSFINTTATHKLKRDRVVKDWNKRKTLKTINYLKSYNITYPELKKFHVLIKDTGIDTINDIPMFYERKNVIRGMVLFNDMLDGIDREYVAKKFPSVDVSNLVIIEKDRTPDPAYFFYTLIFVGLASFSFGAYKAFFILKPEKTSDVFDDEDALTKYAKKRNPHLYDE